MTIEVPVRRLPHGDGLPLPSYATPGSAGLDLLAAVAVPVTLGPGTWDAIPTGLTIALPEGWEAQIRARSGLAFKFGVTVLNGPGTIDADYRGEIKVILINHGTSPFVINRGDRIAQMVIAPAIQLVWRESEYLPETGRGSGGFGSTGTS